MPVIPRRYTFYNWLEKKKGCRKIEFIGPVNFENEAENKAIHVEELNFLRREISLLSKNFREIINLYYFEEKSCKEIARQLNISEGTVKWRLHEARIKIKRGMESMSNYGKKSFKPDKLNIGISGQAGTDKSPFSLVDVSKAYWKFKCICLYWTKIRGS